MSIWPRTLKLFAVLMFCSCTALTAVGPPKSHSLIGRWVWVTGSFFFPHETVILDIEEVLPDGTLRGTYWPPFTGERIPVSIVVSTVGQFTRLNFRVAGNSEPGFELTHVPQFNALSGQVLRRRLPILAPEFATFVRQR